MPSLLGLIVAFAASANAVAFPNAPVKTCSGPIVISYVAKFEDTNAGLVANLPVKGVTPLKAYDSLSYENLAVIQIEAVQTVGLLPKSPSNVIVYDPVSNAMGSPHITSLYVDSMTDYFNFKYFYFGCALASQETLLGAPLSCSITIIGTKAGKTVATQSASFTPSSLLLSNMVQVNITKPGFQNVDTVSFVTNGGGAATTAVLFDNIAYDAVLKQKSS